MIHKEVLKTNSLEFSSIVQQKVKSGEKLYSLGLGEPFWQVPELARKKLSELAINRHFGYSSPFGNLKLRDYIAQDLTIKNSFDFSSQNILIAAGAKQALQIALKSILKDEDEVIILDPCYVSYRPQVLLANHNAKVISCPLSDNFKVNLIKLKKLINFKTKAILINTPNNPSGALISRSEMESLVNIAKEYNVYLVCDEIYQDFIFFNSTFFSANNFRKQYNRIITIGGFSKTFSMTGWRIGYFVATQELILKASKIVQHEMTNLPEMLQVAACEVFSLPKQWFDKYRLILERNLNYYINSTENINVLKNIHTNAGMFCFPKFEFKNKDIDSDQLTVELLKDQNVAITPGIIFGKRWNKYLRISLSLSEIEFKEAIDRFVNFIKRF